MSKPGQGGRGRQRVVRHGPAVTAFEVDRDEMAGTGGFLAIRRLQLRNRRADGTTSRQVSCDYVVRPYGIDAVAVAIWARVDGRVEVLLREQLRPTPWFGRADQARLPVPDRHRALAVSEVVAGILEPGDVGEAGLRQRAALEVAEEAGYAAEPAAVVLLGAAAYLSPGAMAEKCWLAAVEVDPAAQSAPSGDGSPLEEGSMTYWLELDEAIAACVAGDLEDAKTELALRRLKDFLSST
jgi:ADP-ribose pyrophosphatase